MSSPHAPPSAPDSTANFPSLTDRLHERVRLARLVTNWPAQPRRRQSDLQRQPPAVSRTPDQIRAARSLRLVFIDMGNSYREYRSRTGAPVSPGVREAAQRFRRERDLASLAAVAASLDQLQVLTW